MHSYESTLGEEPSTARKRPRPMSRPLSKNFNRISDFIFPDTVHIRLPELPPLSAPLIPRYRRVENYSLPVFRRHSLDQHDLIVVERLPATELVHLDLLYRDQPPLVQRRSSLHERMRDRRKRHTTDNAYHSLLKSMTEDDERPWATANKENRRYPPSGRATLDPIIDVGSLVSLHQRPRRTSISSRDSSSDTDITVTFPKVLPTVWERFPPTTLFIDEDGLDKSNHPSGKGN